MKIKIYFILLLTSISSVFAQTGGHDICSATTITSWSTSVPTMGFNSTADAKQIIKDIIAVIGLKPNFEVQAANIPNAAAVVYRGKRYVLYNPDFINRLNAAAGNKWASISVLAHEIGHHLDGHTLDGRGSRPEIELEADEFSGFVLRRMGATLREAQLAMKIAADYKQSVTHPAKDDRLTAIAGGWNNADRQITGRTDIYNKPDVTIKPAVRKPELETRQSEIENRKPDVVVNRPVQKRQQESEAEDYTYPPTRTSNNTVLADKYILRDVKFISDSRTPYYITTNYNLVKIVNGNLYMVGKLTRLNDRTFPFVITDNRSARFYVSVRGIIVSSSGNTVGYMMAH